MRHSSRFKQRLISLVPKGQYVIAVFRTGGGDSRGQETHCLIESFIFSQSVRSFEHGVAVHQPMPEFATQLKSKPGKDIWLVGGGELAGAIFAANVVDELIVYVHPILLGSGLPLASNLPGDVVLRFEAAEPFETGLVKLRYTVAERGSPG